MKFEFATATRIVFGPGTLAEAGKLAGEWGRRAVVVTGRNPARAQRLLECLAAAGIATGIVTIDREPSTDDVARGVALARAFGADAVIGFGGGSAIDAAKAIAGLLTNDGAPLDYLEVVGQGRSLARPAAPWMAIPTTAGTGAEVTRNAVLAVAGRGVKASLRSPHLLARVALVDPELTLDLPPGLTAGTGLDALTQLIEAYVCNRANPLTDAICAAGIPRATHSLPAAWRDGHDLAARSDLALASLWSGLALANSGLGAVHGFAAPIGGLFPAPHGAVCAALLAPVMAANIRALRIRAPQSHALMRYAEIAHGLTRRIDSTPEHGVESVRSLVVMLGIPRLSAYGIAPAQIPEIVARAQQASSMKANPVVLTAEELSAALTEAI